MMTLAVAVSKDFMLHSKNGYGGVAEESRPAKPMKNDVGKWWGLLAFVRRRTHNVACVQC